MIGDLTAVNPPETVAARVASFDPRGSLWILSRAMSLVLSFKHPTFAEEHERRTIHLAGAR